MQTLPSIEVLSMLNLAEIPDKCKRAQAAKALCNYISDTCPVKSPSSWIYLFNKIYQTYFELTGRPQ